VSEPADPLKREYVEEYGSLDLIDKFVAIASEYTDAPDDFLVAAGYHLVSSLLGRFTVIAGTPNDKRPNPWFLLSSVPGLMRRSTVVNLAERVYRRALRRFYEETRPKKPGESEAEYRERIEKLIDDSIIEEGTVEGLTDHIEDAYGGEDRVKEFVIHSPEFGAVLSRMTERHYQAGVLSLLSKLKYGEGGVQYLSRRRGQKGRRYIPRGLFVTMLASMQELEYYVRPEHVRQGLMRRIIVVFQRPSQKKRYLPPLLEELERERAIKLLDLYAEELAEKMLQLNEMRWYYASVYKEPLVPIMFRHRVARKINAFAERHEELLKKADETYGKLDDIELYKQGYAEWLIELSAVRCLARCQPTRIAGLQGLCFSVEDVDYEKAKEFLLAVARNVEEAFKNVGVITKPPTVDETPNRLYRLILRRGKEGITKSELSNTGITDIDKHLRTLLDADRIVAFRKITGKRGRPPIIIYARECLTEEELEELERRPDLEPVYVL